MAPLQELLNRWAGGSVLRGGPQWPGCPALIHFRGQQPASDPAFGLDDVKHWPHRPERLFWCGPLCDHFGHQVGEFASRILISSLDPRPGTLLFLQQRSQPLHPWQQALIAYLNPRTKPVLVTTGGFVAERLVAIPQQQRLAQDPSPFHLFALTWLSRRLRHKPIQQVVVLSRARYAPAQSARGMRGSFAGEAMFDAVLQALGARIVYPEEMPLHDQLQLFCNARRLIVSEGSALHGLELMGYQPQTRLVVIARRPLWHGQERPLQCRFPDLHWLEAVQEMVWRPGTNPRVKGLARLDWNQLLPTLGALMDLPLTLEHAAMVESSACEQLAALAREVALESAVPNPSERRSADDGGW